MKSSLEIDFLKYKLLGAYHWDEISNNIFKRNAFVYGRYSNVIKIIENIFKEGLHNNKILDLGCGDGVLSHLLNSKGAIVSGIDYSEIAIEFAKEKTKGSTIDFTHGSAYDLPYDDNSFDIVVSSDVIEHLQNTSIYLSEIKRVVRPKGLVVISTPIRFTEKPLDTMHVVEWYQGEFIKLIESYFPNGNYMSSHPLFWMELYKLMLFNKPLGRFFVNIMSYLVNPFEGFNSKFKYHVLQYAVLRK